MKQNSKRLIERMLSSGVLLVVVALCLLSACGHRAELKLPKGDNIATNSP